MTSGLAGVRISLCDQRVEQFQEQQAGLPLAFDVSEPARLGIPRASKYVPLLVTSGSLKTFFCPAALGPIRSDLGMKVDVDLVEIQHDLVGSKILDQSLDRPQSTSPTCLLPGAVDDRLRPLQDNSRPAEKPAHGRNTDRDLDPVLADKTRTNSSWSKSVALSRTSPAATARQD